MLQIRGDQLRAARYLVGGPTLRDVAKATGLAITTLHRLETGGAGKAKVATLGRFVAFLEDRRRLD